MTFAIASETPNTSERPNIGDIAVPFEALGSVLTTPKATPGYLKSVHGANRNGSTRYLQIFNSTAATTTVIYQWAIPAGGQILIGTDFFSEVGWLFTVGVTIGVSTTSGSYVAATASEHDIAGSYR